MTIKLFLDQSPGPGSNSQPLDQQSDSLQIAQQGPSLCVISKLCYKGTI